MRLRKCSLPPPIKFLLSIGLVVSLSGCWILERDIGEDFVKESSNITTPNRTTYPSPTRETCSVAYRQKNNLTVAELRNAINYGVLQKVIAKLLPYGGAATEQSFPDLYAAYETNKMKLIQAVDVISMNLQALKAESGNTGNFAVNVNTGGFAAFEAVSQVNAWLTPKSLGSYLTGCLKYTKDGSGMTLLQQATALGSEFTNVKFPQVTLETCTAKYFNNPELNNVASAAQEEAFLNYVGVVTAGQTPQGVISQITSLSATQVNCQPTYYTYKPFTGLQDPYLPTNMTVPSSCQSVLSSSEDSVANTYNKAVLEAQNHANYTDLIKFFAKYKPLQLANYDVGCFMLQQKNHIKLQVNN